MKVGAIGHGKFSCCVFAFYSFAYSAVEVAIEKDFCSLTSYCSGVDLVRTTR